VYVVSVKGLLLLYEVSQAKRLFFLKRHGREGVNPFHPLLLTVRVSLLQLIPMMVESPSMMDMLFLPVIRFNELLCIVYSFLFSPSCFVMTSMR